MLLCQSCMVQTAMNEISQTSVNDADGMSECFGSNKNFRIQNIMCCEWKLTEEEQKLCSWRCERMQRSGKPLPIKADSLKKKKKKTWFWSRSRLKSITVSPSVGRTLTAKNLLQQCPDSRCNAGFPQCTDCLQLAGCSKTTLCNHSKLSKRTHGYLLLSVSSDSHTHRSVTSPRCGTRRWSSMPVWATIHDKKTCSPSRTSFKWASESPHRESKHKGDHHTIRHQVRKSRLRGDRYHREHAIYSPYYKWRRCFWQSFSLQCPPHSHLHKINMILEEGDAEKRS